MEDRFGTRGATADHDPHTTKINRRPAWVLLHSDKHRRYAKEEGGRAVIDQVEDLIDVEAAADNRGTTDLDEWCGEDVQAAGVEERCVENSDIVGSQPPTHHRIDGVGGNAAMGENSTLRRAGTAAGVANDPRVIPA